MTSDTGDWQDPFSADDAAARERAERRAEREARRAKRRGKVAEHVKQVQAEAPAVEPPPAERAPVDPVPASTAQQTAVAPTVQTQEAPAAAPPAPPHDDDASGAATTPPARPPRSAVHRRRLVALFGLVALTFVGLVIVVGVKKLGGDDPVPVSVKPQKTKDITIPEGYSRSQIAEVAKKAGIKGDYEEASKSAKGFDPGKYGAENPSSLEGFLFPATYNEFKKKATADDLVQDQLQAFKENIKGVDMSYAKSKNLTVYDILIIASMIEREVQIPEERPKVAAVIYNRLSQGMPLGIDATIRYAVGNFTDPLTESELAVDSPYNTRTNAGLPPGPIGNPGLDSIEAAANPDKANYLYYVVKPGTCGEHVFTDSEAEFDQAVADYNAARDAAGGKSPDTC